MLKTLLEYVSQRCHCDKLMFQTEATTTEKGKRFLASQQFTTVNKQFSQNTDLPLK